MPINLPGVPFKLTAEDMGGFDIGEALKQGFNLNKQFQEARTMPKKLAEELLAAKIKNKHDETINQFLPRSEEARISATESNTGLDPIRKNLWQAQTNKANRPAPIAYNTLEKALNGQKRVIQEYGEDSPQARAAQKYVDHLAEGSKGAAEKIPSNKLGALFWLKNHPDQIPSTPNNESYIQSIRAGNQGEYEPNKKLDLDKLIDKELNSNGKSKQYAPSNTYKEVNELADAKAGFVPGTDKSQRFESPEQQKFTVDALERAAGRKEETAEAMNDSRRRRAAGLKQGEDYVNSKGDIVQSSKDATAIRRPFSEREKKEQSGRLAFNVTYPFILKSTSYYSGKGSIKRFNHDIANFDNDPKAQKRIINYLTASQLISQGTIKETATLGGANTNRVYGKLEKSLNASDIPIKFELLEKQFRLPNSANLRAGLQYSSLLNRSLKAAESLPARHTEYLSGDHEGSIYNEKTGKIDHHLVSPEDWDEFKEAGGY